MDTVRVLVIEDDRLLRGALVEAVHDALSDSAAPVEVTQCETLSGARLALRRDRFALVLLDLGLGEESSGMNTLDAVADLAGLENVLVVSARHELALSVAGRGARFLGKPPRRAALLEAIRVAVRPRAPVRFLLRRIEQDLAKLEPPETSP